MHIPVHVTQPSGQYTRRPGTMYPCFPVVVMVCCCAGLWTGTSGSSISRKASSFKLHELSQYRQFGDRTFSTDVPTTTATTPTQVPLQYQHWVECPILEKLLDKRMKGFPEVTNAIDSFQIPNMTFKTALQRAANTFAYIQNPGLTMDLLIGDLARIILDKRGNCTVTMYQRVFIYAMSKQLDAMMRTDDKSMLSQVVKIVVRHFPSRQDMVMLCPHIVHGVHETVFKEIVVTLQRLEFRYLDWLLHIVRTKTQEVFDTSGQLSSNDLANKMWGILSQFLGIFPEVLKCTSANDLIGIHKIVASHFSDHYFKMLKTGYISSRVIGDLDLLFRLPFNGLTSPIDMDDPKVDLMLKDLESIILDYATEVMNKTEAYEQSLTLVGVKEPPELLLSILTPSEVADTMTLFTRAFGSVPSPTDAGIVYSLADTLTQGKRELSDLLNVIDDMERSNSTEQHIIVQMSNIIGNKTTFLNRLENQLQNKP
ncbi:uncharacterized protein LOC117321863 [Pecten maximus]|uniref:uncharacterized protein LOC117321863 n=1 Tax=Pecten maximus TaxID=6579 RepID=UPI001458BA86|nr:uncharacterized protein LOC117321863 [Pecten maximus]